MGAACDEATEQEARPEGAARPAILFSALQSLQFTDPEERLERMRLLANVFIEMFQARKPSESLKRAASERAT
jgi:hypothetical protein